MSDLHDAVRAFVADTVLPQVEAWDRADELAWLRRDAPQTQIGEGANDALLLALARSLLR